MSLTSTDIRPGLAVPVAHIYTRCGGENISPNLAWSGAPRGMRFVLTMIDVDVKPGRMVALDCGRLAGSSPSGHCRPPPFR
jgi:phosphatidylethanolamine-binding protein (PEBP) family uncharacterized protein